jgi:hypothetical protein
MSSTELRNSPHPRFNKFVHRHPIHVSVKPDGLMVFFSYRDKDDSRTYFQYLSGKQYMTYRPEWGSDCYYCHMEQEEQK